MIMVVVPHRRRRAASPPERSIRRVRVLSVLTILATLGGAALLVGYLMAEPPALEEITSTRIPVVEVIPGGRYKAREFRELTIDAGTGRYEIRQWLWAGRVPQETLLEQLRASDSCTVATAPRTGALVLGVQAGSIDIPAATGLEQLESERTVQLYLSILTLAVAFATGLGLAAELRRRRDEAPS